MAVESNSGNNSQLPVISEYEIVGLIAKGAMGEVYKANDPMLNRDVAIKVLAPSLLSDDGAVVQREALERLGLRIGDRFALGTLTLTVRAVVEAEPDRSASLVRLGPRVLRVETAAIASTLAAQQ